MSRKTKRHRSTLIRERIARGIKMFFKSKKGAIILFLMVGVVTALIFPNHLGATPIKKIKESIDIVEIPNMITSSGDFAPGEIIVKFKDSIEPSSIIMDETSGPGKRLGVLKRKFKVKEVKDVFEEFPEKHKKDLPKLYHIKADRDVDILSMCQEYMEDPDVEYAEPNWIIYASATPNDPSFGNQWALTKIEAEKAWDFNTGSEDIVIAIIDTGIDYTHSDLASHIWINPGEIPGNGIDDDGNGFKDDVKGWNFAQRNNDPMDASRDSHGTKVAGIAAGLTNNSAGIAGLAGGWGPEKPGCKLMAVKIMTEGTGFYLDALWGIAYASVKRANVINMSWGRYATKVISDIPWAQSWFSSMKGIIESAHNKGCLLVGATGNANQDTDQGFYRYWPADLGLVMGVAATGQNDKKYIWSDYSTRIDVCAPGEAILSTARNNSYDYGSGASFAAPFVSGVAALLFSQNPDRTNIDVRTKIEDTCDTIDDPLYLAGRLGRGRINAKNALMEENYIYLDPGHGGNDPGAGPSIYGDYEKDLNLDMSNKLRGLLLPEGYELYASRSTDEDVSVRKRVVDANKKFDKLVEKLKPQFNNDEERAVEEARKRFIFVSIHCNSDTAGTGTGTEAYYCNDPIIPERVPKSIELAGEIVGEISSKLGLRNRGVGASNFYVVKYTKMPACLVETAFITGDAYILHYRKDEISEAMHEGVKKYFEQ